MIDRTTILATPTHDDRVAVAMPTWGGTVYLRPLTLAQVRHASAAAEAGGLEDATPMLLARHVEQADGTRIFTDDDAAALEAMPLRTLKPLVTALNRINGFDETAEALAGKSELTPV